MLDFGEEDLGYDVQSGRSTARTTSRVWVPTTVAQTDANYVVKTALLELGSQAVTTSAEEVKGTLCIASDGAPFFSRWDRCGETETGPERSQDQAAVTFP